MISYRFLLISCVSHNFLLNAQYCVGGKEETEINSIYTQKREHLFFCQVSTVQCSVDSIRNGAGLGFVVAFGALQSSSISSNGLLLLCVS